MVSAKKKPTYADIEALPPHLRGEIIAGELVVQPRPAAPHVVVASNLLADINTPFGRGRAGGPGGWWIMYEPELSLGVDADFDPVIPDLAGWRKSRMQVPPTTAQFKMVPDWVCEVLSPGTAAIDRADKLPFYYRAGVQHAWLVDPVVHTLEIYRRDSTTWALAAVHKGNATIRAEPFDAIELNLGELWPPQ